MLRRAPMNLVPRPSPGFAPGGSARCTSSKPVGTTFFDSDITARRSRRSSGTVAIPTAASYSLGDRQAGERAEEPVCSRAGEPDETEVFHRTSQAIDYLAHLHRTRRRVCPHEQEDEEAQAAGPPQQGQPRQEAAAPAS